MRTYSCNILFTPTALPHQDSTSPTTTKSSLSPTASYLSPTPTSRWTPSFSKMTTYTLTYLASPHSHNTAYQPHIPTRTYKYQPPLHTDQRLSSTASKTAIQTCGVSPSPRPGNQRPPTSSVTNNTLNSFSMRPPLSDPLQPKRSTKPLLKGGLPITLPSPQR